MDDAPTAIDRLIEVANSVAGVAIEPHQRDGVRSHLEVARRLAEQVEAASLAAAAENAPVFRP
jgi:hypothetical protein